MPYTRVMPRTNHPHRPRYQRILIDIAGFGLVIAAPFTGIFPGPGGIPVFLAGLGLLSINHEWARKLFENFEQWWQTVTEKIFMAHPWISRLLDATCIMTLTLGIWVAFYVKQSVLPAQIVQGIGIGIITFSLVVILSNQRRYQRVKKLLVRRRR